MARELTRRGRWLWTMDAQLRNLKKTWRELSSNANSAAAKAYALYPVLQQYLGRDAGPVYFNTKSEASSNNNSSSSSNGVDTSGAMAPGLAASRPSAVRTDAAHDASRSVLPSSSTSSDASVASDAESAQAQLTSDGAVRTSRPSQRTTDSAHASDAIAVESSASDSDDADAPHFAAPLTGRTRARSDSVSSSSSTTMLTPPPRKRLSKGSLLSRVSPAIAASADAVATVRGTYTLGVTVNQSGVVDQSCAAAMAAAAARASDARDTTATETLSRTTPAGATALATSATTAAAPSVPATALTPAAPTTATLSAVSAVTTASAMPSTISDTSGQSKQSTGGDTQRSDGGIDARLLEVASGLRAMMDSVVASREAASEQELLRAEMREHSATMKALSEQVRQQTAALERLTELLGATFSDA